jgi:hypothetical protein
MISLYCFLTMCRTNSPATILTWLRLLGGFKLPYRCSTTDSSYSVASVTPDSVIYTTKNADGTTEQHSISTNFVLWSTGIAMNPFTKRICQILPNQSHKKAIEVDGHLRVNGAPLGDVYAIGDCSTVSCNCYIDLEVFTEHNLD